MEEWRAIAEGLPWVTAATIAAIALILGIHFRSPVAPLVTLVAAATAYLVSLRTVGVVGKELDVTIPRDAEPILVVLLLGVVTDYAVFFLHGFRERLAAGEDRLRAAEGATAEYLPIVVTAGLIVAGGTLALVAGQLDFFRAFGPGMALTVAISLLVADHVRAGGARDPRRARVLAVARPRGGAAARPGRPRSRGSRRRVPWRS